MRKTPDIPRLSGTPVNTDDNCSGVLLSGRPAVRIRPGTLKATGSRFVKQVAAGFYMPFASKNNNRISDDKIILLILAAANRLYHEFRCLHSCILDVWSWQ